jgi:hypothetical protein
MKGWFEVKQKILEVFVMVEIGVVVMGGSIEAKLGVS